METRQGRRALIIVENLPVPFDRRVWQEAQALKAAGWAVSVICPQAGKHMVPEEEIDGISILRHPLVPAERAAGYLREYAVALFWQLRLSLRVRRRQGIDVIQGCSPPDLIFLVARLHRLFWGTPYIFDHHDLSPELFEVKFGLGSLFLRLLHGLLLRAERATFRSATVSIATNETFRAIAIDRGGMAPERVFVVKSYPEISRFRRTEPDPGLRARFAKLVGWVGIMGSQDGVDMLIRAMAETVHGAGRRDVGCVIIGDGPERPALMGLAAELGLSDHVIFPGYVSGPELLALLSALDLGIIPDPPNAFNAKLSMNKVFEYMMLGLPFLLFDLAQARSECAGAGEVVAEHSAPALAAAMLRLLGDPERCAAMGRAGRAEAEQRFLWSKEAGTLLQAWETARGGPPLQSSAGIQSAG